MAAELATAHVLERYERDGYAVFRGVLDSALLKEASDHVSWLQERNPGLRPEKLDHQLLGKDPFWLRLVSDPRLLDIAEQFIGPNIALFASHYFCKPPGDGQPVLWHQDGSYWPLEPMKVVSLWLAVDDSTAANGCLRVIPGTQHLTLQPLQQRSDIANVLGSGIDPAAVDATRAIDLLLKAGDVSVHHPNIVHGSNANTSSVRRCGLTIRYIPTTTRIVASEPWPSSFLLRGVAVPGINTYLSLPKYWQGEHLPFRGCEGWAPGF